MKVTDSAPSLCFSNTLLKRTVMYFPGGRFGRFIRISWLRKVRVSNLPMVERAPPRPLAQSALACAFWNEVAASSQVASNFPASARASHSRAAFFASATSGSFSAAALGADAVWAEIVAERARTIRAGEAKRRESRIRSLMGEL